MSANDCPSVHHRHFGQNKLFWFSQPLKSRLKQNRGSDPVPLQSMAMLLFAQPNAKPESQHEQKDYHGLLQPHLSGHVMRWEWKRANLSQTKTQILCDLECIRTGQLGRAGLDLTFVSYLVLQTSASLITNCTLVVIISNHMILFYMWRFQNQKNMEQWMYSINVLSGCSIQLPLTPSSPFSLDAGRYLSYKGKYFSLCDSSVTDFLVVKITTAGVSQFALRSAASKMEETWKPRSPWSLGGQLWRCSKDSNKAQLKPYSCTFPWCCPVHTWPIEQKSPRLQSLAAT